jgi:hypothetical protein
MAGLALYAIFLVTSQFEHHDLLCELKTPLHCTACTSSVVGSNPASPAIVGAWTLTDVGRADAVDVTTTSALLALGTTGRSPPTRA